MIDASGNTSDIDGHVRPELDVTFAKNETKILDLGKDASDKPYTSVKKVSVTVEVLPVQLTQAEYDTLEVKDPETIYLIKD